MQASLPTSPPAHTSLGWSWNLLPVPGLWLLRATFRLELHLLGSTRGSETFFCLNWKLPSASSLPHPATQHLTPVPLANWWSNMLSQEGRHAVFTLGVFRLMSLWWKNVRNRVEIYL